MSRPMRDSRPIPGPRSRVSAAIFIFLGAASVGFLAGALALRLSRTGEPRADLAGATEGPARPEAVPVFTDVTAAAGIRFHHENGATGRFYYPEVMGAGCALFDADGDGRLDIFLVNGNRLPPPTRSPEITSKLYRNRGDGTFEDLTARAGVGEPSYGQGACAADFDGDGDQDLYVTGFGPGVLHRNRGGGTFEKAEGEAADPGWGQACAFFDADGDGWLDLYVQHYLDYSIESHEEWHVTIGGKRVLDYCSPSGYHGQQDRLYRNLGNGHFRDITAECGIVAAEGTGMGLVCADLDGDGRMDIAVANDSRPNFLFHNEGQGRFAECGLSRGLAFNGEGGTEAFMGIDAGDFDGDGLLDLVIPSLRTEGFNLYRNLGSMFAEVSVATGLDAVTSSSTGFAPVFIDYDSDGDLDLFFTCGEVRMGRTDAGEGASLLERYAMPSLLLENRAGRWANVSERAGPFFRERRVARAASAGDFDDDGDLDLLVTTLGGEPALLRNDTPRGHWIGFRLEGRPPNRDAVGAELRLSAGGRVRVSQVFAGGSYLGQRDRRQLFGLGPVTGMDGLEVRWPGGRRSVHRGLEVDRYHRIVEEGP